MKIAYIINNLANAGAEIQVINIINNLKDKHEVHLILLNSKNSTENLKKIDKIKTHILSDSKRFSISFFWQLFRILKINNYDVIHSHLFPTYFYIGILKPLINSRFIYTEHSINNNRKDKELFELLNRFILNKYDYITCVSEATKNELIKNKKIKTDVVVVNNGVNLDYFKPNNRLKNNTSLTMVSRFTRAKDQYTLIKAFSRIKISKIELQLVGDGSTFEDIKNFTQRNKFKNIKFLGQKDNVNEVLNDTYIYIQSSRWESFGIAAVEAMAKGIPVVHTNVEGLREIVANEKLRFEVGDEEELYNILMKLLTNENLWKNSSAHSLKQAKNFNINNVVSSLESLYRKM